MGSRWNGGHIIHILLGILMLTSFPPVRMLSSDPIDSTHSSRNPSLSDLFRCGELPEESDGKKKPKAG